MKKIPTVFERDWNGDRSRVIDKVHSGCEWVLAGKGIATRKVDGSCCMVRNGKLYARRELRHEQLPPAGFEQVDYDTETGKVTGWIPVDDSPGFVWHRAAFSGVEPDGTYELIGPKIQGNPEGVSLHTLVLHSTGLAFSDPPPRTFDALRDWLAGKDIEGIVWHHPDGRMAKIKLRDFGHRRLAEIRNDSCFTPPCG